MLAPHLGGARFSEPLEQTPRACAAALDGARDTADFERPSERVQGPGDISLHRTTSSRPGALRTRRGAGKPCISPSRSNRTSLL